MAVEVVLFGALLAAGLGTAAILLAGAVAAKSPAGMSQARKSKLMELRGIFVNVMVMVLMNWWC